jgi:hypothetical protein
VMGRRTVNECSHGEGIPCYYGEAFGKRPKNSLRAVDA